jgi:hypothetical protein
MPRGRPRKNPDTTLLKSAELIGWALGGLEREIVVTKARLAALNAQAIRLRGQIGKRGAEVLEAVQEGVAKVRKRRKMSPEGRKRISDMMKKRWAERRKAKGK